jgi:hypothetical protein
MDHIKGAFYIGTSKTNPRVRTNTTATVNSLILKRLLFSLILAIPKLTNKVDKLR